MQHTTAETYSSGIPSWKDSWSVEEGGREGKEGKSQPSCYYKPNLNPSYITRGSVLAVTQRIENSVDMEPSLCFKCSASMLKTRHAGRILRGSHTPITYEVAVEDISWRQGQPQPPCKDGGGLSPSKNSTQKNLCCRPCLASPILCSAYQCPGAVTSHTPPSQQEQKKNQNHFCL